VAADEEECPMANGKLQRSRSNKWVAGVCGGVAEFTGLSPGVVRLAFALFGIFGVGEVVYLLMWVLVPKA